ncbi:16S rRNA (guanine(966)-N(2))-methyltransferase RsmD [Gudongella sp. DL1XJH-153]|uniref:16S rRNA (guanine(966)-N(2))-methyltransferase RsmD n=1 Tax=Gudongella sp. DL1XJH-153 TaxID=3409804 RepID=UPI003BB5EECA
MRVISGIRKGHKLIAPKGGSVRPTEDRVKESLFNILSPLKSEAIVLDLFAGSGGIGIEFLSRGASKVYFVDNSYDSIEAIRKNLEHTKLREFAEVLRGDARTTIKKFSSIDIVFDYIYIDPPYAAEELFHKTLQLIADYKMLSHDGIIIVEHDKSMIFKSRYSGIELFDTRNYGSKEMTYFRNEGVAV